MHECWSVMPISWNPLKGFFQLFCILMRHSTQTKSIQIEFHPKFLLNSIWAIQGWSTVGREQIHYSVFQKQVFPKNSPSRYLEPNQLKMMQSSISRSALNFLFKFCSMMWLNTQMYLEGFLYQCNNSMGVRILVPKKQIPRSRVTLNSHTFSMETHQIVSITAMSQGVCDLD